MSSGVSLAFRGAGVTAAVSGPPSVGETTLGEAVMVASALR